MKFKILLVLTCMLIALPVLAGPVLSTMVELSDRYKVLKVNELHRDVKTQHILRIICFVDGGRNLVFEDKSTGLCYVLSSKDFGKRYEYVGNEHRED